MRARRGSIGNRSTAVWRKLVLAIGFLAVAVATIVAWQTPATEYEVSMYTATPTVFWIGVTIGFLSAAVVTVQSCHDRIAGLAVGLGWITAVSIGSLPVIRSYRFFGRGDSMTHLGWATELLAGRMRFNELFYPAGHSITVLLTDSMAVPVERGMILFAALCFALFTLFIPLIAKALFEDRRLTVIAAFSGFMMLPINQISNGLYFHTYSIAMLLFPMFLYVLVKRLTSDGTRSLLDAVDPWNVVLGVIGVMIILTHPQVGLNLIILLGTLVLLHIILRNREGSFTSNLQPVHGVFILLAVVWLVWIFQFDRVSRVGMRVLVSTYDAILGTTDPGESVETQVQSARSVEATILELFVKLFMLPAIYSLLASLAVIVHVWNPFSEDASRGTDSGSKGRSVVIYFGYAGLVLGPFFVAHFMGPVSHLFFRHYGFAMTFITVLGALMIHRIVSVIPTAGWSKIAKSVAIGLLAVSLALSLLTIFASPYIYNASHHVTDQHMSGYETAIEYRDDSVQWDGVRGGPGREFDALEPGVGMYNRPAVTSGDSTYGDQSLRTLLSGEYENARYLPVSQTDVDREVIAYRELRYSKESFELIGTQNGVHHVQDNGEFDLYYVTPRNADRES